MAYISIILSVWFVFYHQVAALDSDKCIQQEILKKLYLNMYEALERMCADEMGQENIELLDVGIPLLYSKFNPGKPSRFAKPGDLPMFVLENGQSLVDQVYPVGSARYRQAYNITDSVKGYHFDSLSSTYDYILTHIVLTPQNFSDVDVLRAKYYLQELVPNPERVIRNDTELPRFLLYDFYRKNYTMTKSRKDDEIALKRTQLTQQSYELWGQKKLSVYESDTEAAYYKWQEFGYKSEVEKQLQYFDIDTHEDRLMSTRALFKSMARPSERDAHVTIYPYQLEPEDWYQQLEVTLPESADELRYRKSQLLTKQALLTATSAELSNVTSADIDSRLETLKRNKEELMRLVQNAVDKLLHMEVECFTKINLTACGEIKNGHTAFHSILEEITEHFEQAEYLESVLNGRENTLPVLRSKLNTISNELKNLDSKISIAEKREVAEEIEVSTSSDFESASCPALGQIKFTFDSEACCQVIDCPSNECFDSRVPVNATTTLMWNVQSCAVDNELKALNQFDSFTEVMNSAAVKFTASLQKVKIKRSWMDVDMLEQTDHYTMKRNSGIVSPGPLPSREDFLFAAHSGRYLLPHYVSSFIVASNIKLFYPNLGSWNFSDSSNEVNNIVQILMKYAYTQILNGGVGPFSFALPTGLDHNFQLKRQNGGLLITLPGGQVIGYILKTVPKFPENQTKPNNSSLQCDTQPLHSSNRRKRSISEDNVIPKRIVDLKKYARSLFSESLRGKNVDELLQEVNRKINKGTRDKKIIKGRKVLPTPGSANSNIEDSLT